MSAVLLYTHKSIELNTSHSNSNWINSHCQVSKIFSLVYSFSCIEFPIFFIFFSPFNVKCFQPFQCEQLSCEACAEDKPFPRFFFFIFFWKRIRTNIARLPYSNCSARASSIKLIFKACVCLHSRLLQLESNGPHNTQKCFVHSLIQTYRKRIMGIKFRPYNRSIAFRVQF